MEERRIDPKIMIIWLFPTIGSIILIWLVLSVLYYAMQTEFGFLSDLSKPLGIILILAALLLFIGIPSYLWHQLTYLSFTYALTDTELLIREGVFTRKKTAIPYAKIQNINTKRTFFERILGLATIMIETAGSNPGAPEGVIPGISNSDALVHELLRKIEETKKGAALREEKREEEKGEEKELLKQILAELKAMREEAKEKEGRAAEKFAAMHGEVALLPREISEAEGMLEKQIEKYMKKKRRRARGRGNKT